MYLWVRQLKIGSKLCFGYFYCHYFLPLPTSLLVIQLRNFTINLSINRSPKVLDYWIWKWWDQDLFGSMLRGMFISLIFHETCENDNKYCIYKKLFFVESGKCGNFHIVSALWQLNSCLRNYWGETMPGRKLFVEICNLCICVCFSLYVSMQEVRAYLNYLNDLNSQEQPIVPDNLIRNILHFLIIYFWCFQHLQYWYF